jgi:hypothetical protein
MTFKPKYLLTVLLYVFAGIGLLFTTVFIAMHFGLTNSWSRVDNQQERFINAEATETPEWEKGEEWQVFMKAVLKDVADIDRASRVTGISPRLLTSILAVEQLRLFYTERAVYEQIFSPLKILGVQSQFSWGVMGIKQDTAIAIESNLKDLTSPYYLGSQFEHVLDFTTSDPDTERFERLTNDDSRYYSYLYSSLYLLQLTTAWEKARFPIDDKPGVIATLFNIGFENSHPKAEPQLGGSSLLILGTTYSFGGLAEEIYHSQSMVSLFPGK